MTTFAKAFQNRGKIRKNADFSFATKFPYLLCLVWICSLAATACSRAGNSGPLISSRTTMMTAWEFPKNPLTDKTLDDSKAYDPKVANQVPLYIFDRGGLTP